MVGMLRFVFRYRQRYLDRLAKRPKVVIDGDENLSPGEFKKLTLTKYHLN